MPWEPVSGVNGGEMVPFEKIGPGQSIRLAWQVMGKGGPIPNPAGIRYLEPGAWNPGSGATGLMYANTALAGLNLIASGANLAISAQTLTELRRVSRRVEDLVAGQNRIESKVEQALASLERIELGVSESRLARVVANALKAAAREDGLEFEPFHQLAEDLQSFLDDAGIVRGLSTNLKLGSDLRADLMRIVAVLRGVRLRLAGHWNRQQDDPARVWRCDALEDYWARHEIMEQYLWLEGARSMVIAVTSAMCAAHDVVEERFSFDSLEDHAELHQRMRHEGLGWYWGEYLGANDAAFNEASKAMHESGMANAGRLINAATKTPWAVQEYFVAYTGGALEAAADVLNRGGTGCAIPLPVYFVARDGEGPGIGTSLKDFRQWWLYQSDDGLVYRAWLECAGVAHGYGEVWPEIGELSAGVSAELPAPDPVLVELSESGDASSFERAKPVRRFR